MVLEVHAKFPSIHPARIMNSMFYYRERYLIFSNMRAFVPFPIRLFQALPSWYQLGQGRHRFVSENSPSHLYSNLVTEEVSVRIALTRPIYALFVIESPFLLSNPQSQPSISHIPSIVTDHEKNSVSVSDLDNPWNLGIDDRPLMRYFES